MHAQDHDHVAEDIKMICDDSIDSIVLCTNAFDRLQYDRRCADAVEKKSHKACEGSCKAKFFSVVSFCEDLVCII